MYMINTLWDDRNHVFGVPIGTSKYALSKHRLHMESGFLTRTFKRNIAQRITGCGTVTIRLNHKNYTEFVFKNVYAPLEVAELIHQQTANVQQKHIDRVRCCYTEHPFAVAEILLDNPELEEDEYHQMFAHLCDAYR